MKKSKNTELLIIFGLYIVAIVTFMLIIRYAHADEQSPIYINVPNGASDCTGAAGMASGQHQFFISPKTQLSISGAYYDGCGAASVGSAFTSGDTLYSGQVTCDENQCGGGVSATLKF